MKKILNKNLIINLIFCSFALNSFSQEYDFLTLREREIGERPILFKNEIILEDSLKFRGDVNPSIFYQDQKLFSFKDKKITFSSDINFETEEIKILFIDSLDLTSLFLSKNYDDSFDGDLTGKSSDLYLYNDYDTDVNDYIFIGKNNDNNYIKIQDNEFAAALLTVDKSNDPFPDSRDDLYNSLARIKNDLNDTAIIWDDDNDGKDSGLDADLFRGKNALKLTDPPDLISDQGEDGDFFFKTHNDINYLGLYFNGAWIIFEVQIPQTLPW